MELWQPGIVLASLALLGAVTLLAVRQAGERNFYAPPAPKRYRDTEC